MRSRIVLLIALMALVVGVVGLVDLIKKAPEQVKLSEPVEEVIEERHVTVWKAVDPIVKGQPIAIELVKKTQLPLSEALKFGIKNDTKVDFNPSTLTNIDIHQGAIILPEYQTTRTQSGYIDLLITDGMTLYPLQVSDTNLINDYIRPGGYIDVLTVSSPNINLAANADKPKRFKGVKASMFLKHVKVLSVGDNGNDDDVISARASVKEKGMTSVVIEVHPDDLARLALAQRTMHIEIYRSQTYQKPTYAEVRSIMDNYVGVEEFRGNTANPREAM
ncbi:pilus assembly protein CpaB [Vibrio sp. 10N.286.49.C2]|uniref:RcpC/CpaB family pilus assembly protein n=1 Tax=unclassified Vibrio TaxID=2614977 RepID=UPI000C845C10|nr:MULTISPECIES: RcpC/CpaB family pilus assembly protein [unclassified Vibrio]PMH31597.1 pilus assembly protein CpaB [Vibrio sp. 10N.286.49.C2]PMH50619.1 pilus assembly protein CpaB [Vibrio sp. 10N.286.49.B1]PMH82811.1 pilus assembly protein CpaB [Vibrio sp. 10N.286.48.B7]